MCYLDRIQGQRASHLPLATFCRASGACRSFPKRGQYRRSANIFRFTVGNIEMSTSVPPTSEPESSFVCDCAEWMHSACAGEPFYKEHQSKRYCVLHFPGKEKSTDFKKALQRKLDNKDFNFHGVWFPDVLPFSKFDFNEDADFRFATFNAAADFRSATFNAAANFYKAKFSADANFNETIFSAEAYFDSVMFSAAAYFNETTFRAAAEFNAATFSAVADFSATAFNADAYFSGTTFSAAADFNSATFADHTRFAGAEGQSVFTKTSSLGLQFARIEKPDQVSFHTLTLRPGWFVNIDTRKFDFTNVDWDWSSIDEEIESLGNKRVSSPHRLLAIACRHLAVNAEENHRYEEASKLRYVAMDARRREAWRGFAFWRLSWWYWLASGYGERVWQAFLVLLGIWLLSALLYNHVGFARPEPQLASKSDDVSANRDEVGLPLKFSRPLTYSLGVMTLQKPEPRPVTTAAQTVVLLETILGPVQAALLALAIRRKFMR
jgi:hypothetical protein